MFTITKRSAGLGGKAKADSKELKDGSEVTLLTFELEELKINAAELAALLREPHAYDALYNTGANPIEPYLRGLKHLELAESIADAYVRVDVGLNGYTRFDFKACKLSKIRLELRMGGDTALSCRVTVAPDLNEKLATLLEFLGHSVQAELRGEAPGAQADLPLNKFTDGGAQAPMSNTGRQIQAAAAKVERKKRGQARKDIN
jgi:hypothetical protein